MKNPTSGSQRGVLASPEDCAGLKGAKGREWVFGESVLLFSRPLTSQKAVYLPFRDAP